MATTTMTPTTTGTTVKKKTTNIPLQDPNNPNQPLPLTAPAAEVPTIQPQQVQPVAPQQSTTGALATNALTQAATAAGSNVQPTQTAQQTSQLTQKYLSDPNLGFDPSSIIKTGLTNYDRTAANALEVARGGMVGASGSSLAQSGLQDLALRTAEGRSTVEGDLTQSASEMAQNNVVNALTQGRGTAGMESDLTSANVANNINVVNAANAQLNREEAAIDRGLTIAQANQNAALQTSLTELKGKIDTGNLLRAQDFEATQNELDREIAMATSQGNWENARELLQIKGEIDAKAQAAAQSWQTGERVATQIFSSSERMSSQDFEAAQNYLKTKSAEAIAAGDNATQKWVAEKQSELQLKMQTNDMTHEEKLLFLKDMYDQAAADKDVNRQKTILTFQSSLKLTEMEKEAGYDMAIETLRADTDKAIAAGNNETVTANLKAELAYKVAKDIEDRKIEWASQELAAKGLDMQVYQQQLDAIDDAIENYGIDPSMKTEFVKQTLQGQGVDTSRFTNVDINAEAMKALSAEMDLQKSQFALTHPEFVVGTNTDGTPKLSADGLSKFNEYFNETMYGEESAATKEAKRVAGYLSESDIPSAQVGDKFKINAPYSYNGQTIPAGEYTVTEETDSYGSKFFGTAQSTTKTYLVGKDGTKYQVDKSRSGKSGNIVSNLWAQ